MWNPEQYRQERNTAGNTEKEQYGDDEHQAKLLWCYHVFYPKDLPNNKPVTSASK